MPNINKSYLKYFLETVKYLQMYSILIVFYLNQLLRNAACVRVQITRVYVAKRQWIKFNKKKSANENWKLKIYCYWKPENL